MKAMETIEDLIEEAKLRTVWWAVCVFAVTYFLTHTSSSMWMNLPMAVLFVSALRILVTKVEFRWKTPSVSPRTYLSLLEKKQLSVNDSRLSNAPPPSKWRRRIDSPVVEAAITEVIDKILKDFVVDLWYSDITPDKEFPELIRATIMDAISEISGRVKEINLVDLLTRDVVDLVGDHLDLFRRNQASIGVDVMGTLSSEERDERLKHHLMANKDLHPALISADSEYKVVQRLIGGVIAIVLRPREAQCPLIRSIARELVTCLVVQPVMTFASPGYINEVIELLFLAIKDDSTKGLGSDLFRGGVHNDDSTLRKCSPWNSGGSDMTLAKMEDKRETSSDYDTGHEEHIQPRPADWAHMLEVATQRRTEVLTPENLENLWTKGRNYKKKEQKYTKAGVQEYPVKGSGMNTATDMNKNTTGSFTQAEEKDVVQPMNASGLESLLSDGSEKGVQLLVDFGKASSFNGEHVVNVLEDNSSPAADGNKIRLKRSNSTSDLKAGVDNKKTFTGDGGRAIISEFYSPDFTRHSQEYRGKIVPDIALHSEGPLVAKLRCRVMGAYFEKLGSKSFAVYSIAVTDAENRTWFVKRRYRNFERLHRHLKDIPNYTLHLPPKRIFSSSTEDAFVHQRCIQLDKYLQDLLSIANVAEQHEVWDFFSASSKNYSYGKSASVMRTLAVNVDDAVDDIVRQFKGVSDGFMRKVVGSAPTGEVSSSISGRNLSWNADDGWHSDNELNSKDFPPRVIKYGEVSSNLSVGKKQKMDGKSKSQDALPAANLPATTSTLQEMPPEWTPPNVSVPILNLVDNVFQLKRRGWLRRQVFWISKQILQLVMEDAIDDWLLRQIYWLRREETIAQGIRWVQDLLWPGGTFFTRVGMTPSNFDFAQPDQKPFQMLGQFGGNKVSEGGSFELQLEASRRANDVKKMLFDGAPTALVSLIGNKQYKRCARDIYYFTQSTVCVKQLAYSILELLLISIFPELRDLVLDLHEKRRFQLA